MRRLIIPTLCVCLCSCSNNADNTTPPNAARSHHYRNVLVSASPARKTLPAQYYFELGCVHLKYGGYDLAARSFRQAISLSEPQKCNALYHWMLAQALVRLGNREEAKNEFLQAAAIYKQLLAEHPERNNFYCLQLARLYADLGDSRNVVKWALRLKCETLAPEQVEAVWQLFTRCRERDALQRILTRIASTAKQPQTKKRAAEMLHRLIESQKGNQKRNHK